MWQATKQRNNLNTIAVISFIFYKEMECQEKKGI